MISIEDITLRTQTWELFRGLHEDWLSSDSTHIPQAEHKALISPGEDGSTERQDIRMHGRTMRALKGWTDGIQFEFAA